MATTKKSLTARVAAGIGAAALASLLTLGGALPASAAANIDPAAPSSITIHKHEQTGAAGTPGTGSATDPVAGDPIPGVLFSVRQVTSLDVMDNATWTELETLTAAEVLADPGTYTLGTDLAPAATDADGITSVDVTGAQGVYLVEEITPLANGVVIPAQPFLVVVPQPVEADSTWNYNVHVFPKNTVTDIVLDVEDVEQEGLGSNITWDLTIPVPTASEGTTIDEFEVALNIDPDLAFDPTDEDAVRIVVGTTPLVPGTDYNVVVIDGVPTIVFTPAGLAVLEANPDQQIVIEFDTTAESMPADGVYTNTADLSVNGTVVSSNEASAYFGGIEIQKTDDQGVALQGAVFEVHDAAGNPVAIDGVTQWTSDENGVVTITGLRTDETGSLEYTVVEISAPAGYQLGATTEWDIAVPVGTTTAVEQTVANPQVPAYALPITGGSGQTAFMIGGAGLILGALGIVLVRRRKAAAQA